MHAGACTHTHTYRVAPTSSPGKCPGPEGSLHHTVGGPVLPAVEGAHPHPRLWEMGLREIWPSLTSAVHGLDRRLLEMDAGQSVKLRGRRQDHCVMFSREDAVGPSSASQLMSPHLPSKLLKLHLSLLSLGRWI